MNCKKKNVVVYGVILLICNSYLSNWLNSADAIEEPGFNIVFFFFFLPFFSYIGCKLLGVFFLCKFAESSQGWRQEEENHNIGHVLNVTRLLRNQASRTVHLWYAVFIDVSLTCIWRKEGSNEALDCILLECFISPTSAALCSKEHLAEGRFALLSF